MYILHSKTLNQYYIGHTENLDDRFFRHNNSGSKATKKANDWKLVYQQEYSSRSEAMKAEMAIKKKKSRKYIEKLISSVGQSVPTFHVGKVIPTRRDILHIFKGLQQCGCMPYYFHSGFTCTLHVLATS
jgi:predicted GIY-YIG superfamily endonuclease